MAKVTDIERKACEHYKDIAAYVEERPKKPKTKEDKIIKKSGKMTGELLRWELFMRLSLETCIGLLDQDQLQEFNKLNVEHEDLCDVHINITSIKSPIPEDCLEEICKTIKNTKK